MKGQNTGRGKKSQSLLSEEDKHLWKRVAASTTPLAHSRGEFLKDEMSRLMGEGSLRGTTRTTHPTGPSPASPSPFSRPKTKRLPSSDQASKGVNPLEDRLFKKLAKGKQKIDGRIDLHGMTQERARIALLDFLQASQGQERRIVLVITGKGKSGEGVLRRMVPQWLSLPAFLPLVNGFREASIGHGGEGALYVRLRRRR